ncbi:hypothetical protein NTH_00139 [Nitratireductor thuwali]|uniref:Uncharacterized protein n=1 Tax=Nitratireductor thuwali TaxID=2267699 RepID=A0ABY5MII6_9HYPH|nr:hypothetical protein NTH_00139 [Nitratireductor thuwali]
MIFSGSMLVFQEHASDRFTVSRTVSRSDYCFTGGGNRLPLFLELP